MSAGPTLAQSLEVAALGIDLASGKLTDPVEIGRRLAHVALDVVPVDELKGYLDDEAAKRADAIADVAEALKLATK